MEIIHTTDEDGDHMICVHVDTFTVFAVKIGSGLWTLNFGLTEEIQGCDWMETKTGRGAFKTMRLIRPAVESIIAEIEKIGENWCIKCDSKRAKLYARYLDKSKINY
jgi:hypothetical protein